MDRKHVSFPTAILSIAVMCASFAQVALAARPTPTIAAASDVADWRVAQLGRQRLPAEVGAGDGLLVITGGAFASTTSADPAQQAAQAVALADAAGFDIVNLAHRDLTGDAAALAAALGSAKANFVSASFSLGSATPWKSHALIERDGKRVAVIGIATRSAYFAKPLPNLQYAEPPAAITRALTDAGNVDALVVLADAPLSEAAAWMKQFPQIDAMIVSGRGGGATGVPSLPRVLRAPPGGQALGVLPGDATKPGFGLRLNAPVEVSQAYQELASRYALGPKLPQLTEVVPPASRGAPTSLETNRLTPVGLTATNRAAVITLRSAGVFDNFAGHAAPAGRKFLVLDVQFRNVLTPAVVRDQQVPVAYQMQKLSDHLYLVADSRRVLPPVPLDGAAGMLSTDELMLPRAGSTAGGKLVYEVDAAAPPRDLALRLYDYAHGHAVLPVLARPANEPTPAEQPASPLAKNEVVEIGVFDVRKADDFAGEKAPAGMQFVSFDVRARSQFTYPADATAFDPKARPGTKTQVGTVADWTDSRKYLQLLADGEFGYVPEAKQTTLGEAPRFLPDVLTGGRVVFLAPKDAKSLALRCDFPNARTPDGKVLRPRGVTLPIEGAAPRLATPKAIASINDEPFVVNVTGQRATESFADVKAGAGKRFVVLDVTVNNRGRDGEMFQTAQQLKIADAAGQQQDIDPATRAGAHRPAELVWVPAGERRSFQVAYQLPTTETRPRLAYAGVGKAEVVELARLAPAGAPDPAAPAAPVAVAPAEPITPGAPPVAPDAPAQVEPAKPQAAVPEFLEVDGKRFPARVPVRPNLNPQGLTGVGLTAEQVNAAIDKGTAFLWNHIKTKDLEERKVTFGRDREHVLAALALVHSGAHKKFPEFDAHLRKFLASYKPENVDATYQIGLFCMLVEAYGDPTFLPQLRRSARWLIENQGPGGSWGYGVAMDEKLLGVAEEKKVLRVAGGRPLDGSDVAQPIARATPWEKGGDGDNSVTQYAVLGLHSASRSRIKPAPELWQRALAAHAERQAQEGGWDYQHGSSGYGSMTCAGVCALALSRHELGMESDPAVQQRLERGLAWISAHFSVTTHPQGSANWLYYYLYSIERVGRILGTEFIGDHEWYPLGAKAIVGNQHPDGRWKGQGEEDDERIAGSFALLFLTRATPSLSEPQRAGPGTLVTGVSLPPGRKLYIILDASGSMLEEMNGKPKFEIAREALSALIQELPPNAELALRAYGYRRRAIEEGANEDSKLLVPMAPVKKPELLQLIAGLRARGKTPLAYSLEQARDEIPAGTEESPVTVLLLTDGGEDTQPRRDPVAAAAAYAKLPHTRFRIVGFDINRQDWAQQLQAMASASGGQYLPAARGDALLSGLRSAVFETPETYVVVDEQQRQVASGKFGEGAQLPAGKYRIRTSYGGRAFEETFWINAGTATAVTFEPVNVPAAPAAPAPAPLGATAPRALPPVAAPAPAVPAPGAQPAGKFCTSCGAALKPGTKFCTQCGARLGG